VVAARLEDRLGGLRAQAEAGRYGCALRLEAALLVLPVAVGTAGVVVVADIEDRHVRASENAPAAIGDAAQLDAGAHRA
jgi:hypothetical protein